MRKLLNTLIVFVALLSFVSMANAEEHDRGIVWLLDQAEVAEGELSPAHQETLREEGGVLLIRSEGEACLASLEIAGESREIAIHAGLTLVDLEPEGEAQAWSLDARSCVSAPQGAVLFVGVAGAYVSESPEAYWSELERERAEVVRVSSLLTR